MKTLNTKTKMTKLMFGALTALVMMTTACSKSSNSPAPAPAPVYPVGCTSNPCNPGAVPGGQLLYNGAGQSFAGPAQIQFQVYGNQTGDGTGYASGVVQIANWACSNGPYLSGSYQFSAQGNMIGGQIVGYGQMNQYPVFVQIDPGVSGTPNSGFFSIKIDGCGQVNNSYTEFSFNF